MIAGNATRTTAVVVIGRNEGSRLVAALASVAGRSKALVYVDSGSSDGSPERAEAAGAEVVRLDPRTPFTAARARNAGFRHLRELHPEITQIQFMDGDCELSDAWLERASATLERQPDIVAVCGWRRERHPERSIYNRICDVEWRCGPTGDIRAFGGDVMIRVGALEAVGGYAPEVIAAEDDEVSVRLRLAGGRIVRLDEEMTRHDAAMERISQWWRRAVRCGHGYAQVGSLHRAARERYFETDRRRVALWVLLPPALAFGSLGWSSGLSLVLLLAYPLQMVRIAVATHRRGFDRVASAAWGVSCVAAKLPQLVGIARFRLDRALRRRARILEYKTRSESS